MVTVRVIAGQGGRPRAGASLIVQVVDTAEQDAPSRILGEVRGRVAGGTDSLLATVTLTPKSGVRPEVWAHVDADDDGRVSHGDHITTQSYPIPDGARPLVEVTVNRV